MEKTYNLFFSWQSDNPEARNKVSNSIKKQVEKIKKHHNIQIKVDQDTRDEAGSPKIEDIVFEKIRNCDIFLADITPVAVFEDKRIPNPNVCVELGFAIKTLGWDRIILVAENDGSWKTKDLPFDINHNRIDLFNPNESLDISLHIGKCLEVCHSRQPKGFVFRNKERDSEEEKLITQESVVFFSQRIGQGFPDVDGLKEFTNTQEIIQRLKAMFDCTLKYDRAIPFATIDPVWWFRDCSAAYIDSFVALNESHILLSENELNIKRVIVYNAGSRDYYRDYIYIEAAADQPCGIETHSEQAIQDFVQSRGYYAEEYAVLQPEWDSPEHIISRKEYDNGAAVIDGSVVPLKGRAKLRVRYLTPFNFIIAAKDSPYNCREFDIKSGDYLNRLLNDGIEYKEFHDFLMSLRRRDQDY